MTLSATLANLPIEEPSWMHNSRGVERSPLSEAAALLTELETEDFNVFVLAYGFGMRLGAVAQTLRLDPAIVFWRIDRALSRWLSAHDTHSSAASLEVAITDLLRGAGEDLDDLPPPPHGRRGWLARELVDELDEPVQARLASRLGDAPESDIGVSGVGVGSLLLIVLVVAGFTLFGLLRDINPYLRGRNLMQEGRFEDARSAFQQAGDTPEVNKAMLLCWLAEGEFGRALAMIDDEIPLGAFMPHEPPLPDPPASAGSRAVFPRGPIANPRPSFEVAAGPEDELVVQAIVDGHVRSQRTRVPARAGLTEVPYPESWLGLPEGDAEWSLLGDGGEAATLDLLPPDERREVRQKIRWLTHSREVPQQAKPFLLGHYLLNRGMLMDAARQFAELTRTFPEAAYPRGQVERLARSLGVDTQHLLR